MRIGFVTQWYDPEEGSALVPGVLARGLSSQGFDIEVVTGFPNFPRGKIYPGFRQKLYSREVRDGITVHRVPLFPDHSDRPLRRGACYASFALTSTSLGIPALGRLDAHLVYGSPVTSGLSLAFMHRVRSTPFVTYVSDLWPDSVLASGIAPAGRSGTAFLKLVRGASDIVYSRSSALIATTAYMRDELLVRYPRVPEVALVYNWIDETLFGSEPKLDVRDMLSIPDGTVVAMYAGTMGHAQTPMHWMHVARSLKYRDDLVFVFVGSGPLESQMRSFGREHGLTNVRFLGQRTVAESAALIAASDIQLISLHESPLLHFTLPSKIQASMASAVPIVSIAGGETARVIEESRCGISHTLFDATVVGQSIESLVEMSPEQRKALGRAGRQYYESHMSEKVGLTRLTSALTAAMK
jgi:colanic acid biosynthesis glycosyl transferase WcaI